MTETPELIIEAGRTEGQYRRDLFRYRDLTGAARSPDGLVSRLAELANWSLASVKEIRGLDIEQVPS